MIKAQMLITVLKYPLSRKQDMEMSGVLDCDNLLEIMCRANTNYRCQVKAGVSGKNITSFKVALKKTRYRALGNQNIHL